MPEVSGLDILRVIGLDPVLQHIPVLILTAASDPATRKQAGSGRERLSAEADRS
jgi:putative two-component system response regulator